MRVTQSMLANNALRNISAGYANLGQLQDRLASGKKFTRASQDPVVAMNGMRYRTQVTEVAQFKRNLSEMYNFMESSDSALGEVNHALQRIRELTVQASNDTYNENDRKNIIQEIKQLSEHISSIGNTKVNDKYLFNGTDTISTPIDLSKLPNYINRPEYVDVTQTELPIEFEQFGELEVGQYFSGVTLDAQELAAQFNFDDVADLEGKIIRIGPFDGGETIDLPLGQATEGVYQFPLTEAQLAFAEENALQVQVLDEEEHDALAPLDPDSPFVNNVGSLDVEVPQNLMVSINVATLEAARGDQVSVIIPGQGPLELTYDEETNSFVANVFRGYDPEAIQAATVEVNGQVVESRFEFELTDVDNPTDYYVTVQLNGTEHRFIYDEEIGKYVNEKPVYASLEEIQNAPREVELIPSASPVSSNKENIEIELLKGVTISNNIRPQSVLSAELFKNIQDITNELESMMGDIEKATSGKEISKYLDKLDVHIDNVLTERANLGARINRVEMIENRVLEQEIIAKRILSENEDADMEKVIIDLQTQESVHRAAMAVGARVIQPSLLDFLR